MAIAQRYVAQQYTDKGGPSGLADVLEVLLDKGLVVDAFVRLSLIGIELFTVDARVVVASVDTYLHFAEAVNRLDLVRSGNAQTLGDRMGGNGPGQRNRTQRAQDDGRQDGQRSRVPELNEGDEGAQGKQRGEVREGADAEGADD